MTSEESRRLRALDGFLLDMDGTIYLGNRLFPWTLPFLDCLRRTGRRRLWLTNNASRHPREYVDKLRRLGIPVELEDIYTSGHATIAWLQAEHPQARLFVLGTPSFERQLSEAGFCLTDQRPDYVLVSFDLTLTYAKLRTACDLIHQGVPFLSTHPDKVCPTEKWPIPDCGAICDLITSATGAQPRYFGKPAPQMARGAMARLGTAPQRTAMVGDRLYTDMRMAADAGITSILVLSGETRAGDLEGAAVRPDFVFPSLAELAQALDCKGDPPADPV